MKTKEERRGMEHREGAVDAIAPANRIKKTISTRRLGARNLARFFCFLLFFSSWGALGFAAQKEVRAIPDVSLRQKEVAKFAFAVPVFESRISIGIYNEYGILIRKLAEMLPEKDFFPGLDGLIAEWDGKNDEGEVVPAGNYLAQGFAVGELLPEGIAFLGNGWMEEVGDALPVAEIRSVASGADGALVLLGELQDGTACLFRWDTKKGGLVWKVVWASEEGKKVEILARNAGQWVAVAKENRVRVFDAGKGAPLAEITLPEEAKWLDVVGEKLLVATEKESLAYSLPKGAEAKAEKFFPLPAGIRSLSVAGEKAMACDVSGGVWEWAEEGWKSVQPSAEVRVGDVLAEAGGGYWALVAETGEERYRVGEFADDGTYLRQIDPKTFRGNPESLARAGGNGGLFVSCGSEKAGKEVLGIRKVGEGEKMKWEIFFQKRIDPDSQEPPKDYRALPLRMQLVVASSMGKGKENSLFRIAAEESGVLQIGTPEGLILADLLDFPKVERAYLALDSKSTNAFRVWVQTRGVVEEYRISGLQRIARLDIGAIAWPPKKK